MYDGPKKNQHYSLNIEDIFTKLTGHAMNWINMICHFYTNETIDTQSFCCLADAESFCLICDT